MIDLDQDYVDLPFRIDQAGTGGGLTFCMGKTRSSSGRSDNERRSSRPTTVGGIGPWLSVTDL